MDIKKQNRTKIAFTAIAFTLALSALSAGGCGDSSSDTAAVGNTPVINASQQTADIKIQFDFPEYKTIEPGIQVFEFSLYDEDLQLCCSRSVQRGDFKQGAYTLTNVPVEAKSVVCLFKDRFNNPVGLTESLSLELTPGATAIITNPDYASAAAELGERLTSLAITSQTPVTINTGEKMQLKVEGSFACRNGAELACDLTKCSRLVYQSSNNSVLRSLGGGSFKAMSGGSAKVYAALGQKLAEADVIVKADAQPQDSEPDGTSAQEETPDTDVDPATVADPEPIAVDTPCSLHLDLTSAQLPANLSIEIRGYDINNQLRLRKENISLNETFKDVDESVTKLAGVMLEKDGQVHGIFLADVNLQGKKSCEVSDPEIITGSELALRGEMVLSSDKDIYNLDDETVYQKTENSRCVTVKCSSVVRYTIIPGVWEYNSSGAFLEELCSFPDDENATDEYGVFRFFEVGTYSISVSYRGVIGVFSVTVIDSSAPAVDDYKLNIDLSSSGLPSGAAYEVRGYNSANSLLFSKQNVSNLNSTFDDIDKNVTKLIGVIKTSNGEPYAMFTQSVSLVNGQVYRLTPTLISGQQLAQQKGSLSFTISTTSFDLKNKTSGGYVLISTSPSLTYNYGNGWTATFNRSDLASWDDFALSSSPYLEYSSSSSKYELKAYETGTYRISASYRGLSSSQVTVNVADSTPAPEVKYSVDVNFASSGLPSNSSKIYCQLFKDGTSVSEEFENSSAASLSFTDVSSQANGIVIKVKNSSGQLVGLLYKAFSFDSNHKAALSSVSVATGSGMNSYIKSFTATPGDSLKTVGTYVTGSAQAELTFNSGKILQTRNVSTEAVWSSSDMTQGTVCNSWKVTHAGESSLRATLGGKTADLKAYASGSYNDNTYQYGEANLNSKKAVSMVTYTPSVTAVNEGSDGSKRIVYRYLNKGSFNGKIIGGTQSSTNQSATDTDNGLTDPLNDCHQAELEIRRRNAEQLDRIKLSSSVFKNSYDRNDNFTKTIDYTNAKTGDTINNLYDSTVGYYDAKVLIGSNGVTLNNYTTSGKIIVLSQIVNGKPLVDTTQLVDLLQVLEIDYLMAKKNPFDKDNKPILDRLRQDVGHECGYGTGGGVSGTEKVVISIVDLGDSGPIAYTNPTNSFPRSFVDYVNATYNLKLIPSNEAEIITFNYQMYERWDVPSMCSNFAHEFGHMISYNTRSLRDMNAEYEQILINFTNREGPLEEGHSDLCSLLCGFCCDDKTEDISEFENSIGYSSLSQYFNSYYYKADDRRTKSTNYLSQISSYSIKDSQFGNSTVTADYGQGFFFVAYLYDRYGLDTLNQFYNSSVSDNAYRNLPLEEGKEDYDLLAYIISQNTGSDITFSKIFQNYGKALLLNSTNETSSVPSDYRLYSIKPGKTNNTEISDTAWPDYYNNTVLPTIDPGNFSTSLSASDIIPWSVNYYVTPNMTYSTGTSTSIFGMWGGLANTFKMMLFDNSFKYESDIN